MIRARRQHGVPQRHEEEEPRATMRILLVSANFAPHVGGIERFTEVLAGALVGRGHEVAVVCCQSGDAPAREARDGFSIHRIRSTYVVDRMLNVPYPLPDPVELVTTLSRAIGRCGRRPRPGHPLRDVSACATPGPPTRNSERAHPACRLRASGQAARRRGSARRHCDARALRPARVGSRDVQHGCRRVGGAALGDRGGTGAAGRSGRRARQACRRNHGQRFVRLAREPVRRAVRGP